MSSANKAVRSGVNIPPHPSFRLGAHAVDRSFGAMHVAHAGCNVSIEFGGGDELTALVDPVGGCDAFAAVVTGDFAWCRLTRTSLLCTSTFPAWQVLDRLASVMREAA